MSSIIGGVVSGLGTVSSPIVNYVNNIVAPQPATAAAPATGSNVMVNTSPYAGEIGILVGVAYAADGATPLMAMVQLPARNFTLTLWGPFIKVTAT